MTAAAPAAVAGGRSERGELTQAFVAMRARLGLVVLLLALAAAAWWSTADRMAGMDAGPGTDLGALGWFLGVWVVMMAAMMFPSLAPTTALYARMTRRRGLDRALLFTSGYLLVWGTAGLAVYGLFALGRKLFGGDLAWHGGGRWFAAGVLAAAALYELTPLKDMCLAKCRSPVGFLVGTWRDGRLGALEMGSRHAGWCLGCCWALMAALFALGVMSLTWMAFVAALIAPREDPSVAPGGDLGHRSRPARTCDRGSRRTPRRPRTRRPRRRSQRHADHERHAEVTLVGARGAGSSAEQAANAA